MRRRRFFHLSLLLCCLLSFPLKAKDERRFPWKMDESYRGHYPQSFHQMRWDIPNIMRQTLIDLSVRLGMNFRDGWRMPLTIGFVDQSPWGTENVLAYVQIVQTARGFEQILNINLGAYEKEKYSFEKVFAHELVHAMLNDAMGVKASTLLPKWFHEGLAVYGADQGDQMVKSYVYENSGFAYQTLIDGLENHRSGFDYAEDYLALRYIYKEHGTNALHNFVREVISRKGDVQGAIEYTTLETWEEFQKHAKEFAKKEIKRIGPRKRGQTNKPY